MERNQRLIKLFETGGRRRCQSDGTAEWRGRSESPGYFLPKATALFRQMRSYQSEQQVSTLSFYLIENYDTPALQDINVRQALNYATNNESIVNDLLDGYGNPATGLMSPTVP